LEARIAPAWPDCRVHSGEPAAPSTAASPLRTERLAQPSRGVRRLDFRRPRL